VSVLLPLEYARGDAAEHLATWASGQTLARERFQLVITSSGSPRELLARVADLLAPHDVLLEVPGAGEIALWNAAAAAASAPWLLISETHCLAEPTCLEALLKGLADDPDLVGATLGVESVCEGRVSSTGGRWVEEIVESRRGRSWSPVAQFGTAIRASVFAELGGLEERADIFSMDLLGARLDERGFAIGQVPDARVKHLFEESVRAASYPTVLYTRGECELRAEADAVFFERYFGYSSEWGNRYRHQASGARALMRALATAVGERSSDAIWMARELAHRLPASIFGVGPDILLARIDAAANEQAVERLPLPASAANRMWRRGHRQRVSQTRLALAAEHAGPLPPITAEDRRWPVEELDADKLIGTHGLEAHEGRRFRWTMPVAHLRIAPSGSAGAIVVDTLGLRGAPLGYVRAVLAGSRLLGGEQLSDDGRALTIELASEDLRAARAHGLTILSKPLAPARSGSPDRRRLGMPFASAEAIAVPG
jgi:hypothetical protein